MTKTNQTIASLVRAEVAGSANGVEHATLVRKYGYEANEAIHDLYMADVLGLQNDGVVYLKR